MSGFSSLDDADVARVVVDVVISEEDKTGVRMLVGDAGRNRLKVGRAARHIDGTA